MERCLRFLREVRPESHRLDIDGLHAAGADALVGELERSAAEYASAADRLAPAPVRPLGRGFWLPECAHTPWLGGLLEDCGVHATCLELTGSFCLGAPDHLRPRVTDEGPVLWPIDRETIAPVWSDGGYPMGAAYRDYHRYTEHRHRAWANDGSPYDHGLARVLAREHAADFVAYRSRVLDGSVCVLTTLDDALDRMSPCRPPRSSPRPHGGGAGSSAPGAVPRSPTSRGRRGRPSSR